MTCGSADGYLELGGVEIANEARIRSYLDNGATKYNPDGIPDDSCCLGCSGFRFNGGYCEQMAWNPCLFQGPFGPIGGYETYERPDGATAATGDPAPWYDANDPDSAEFLGVWIYRMTGWDSTLKREVIPQRFGSGFGAERHEGREVLVEAKLFATSCCGMEYGKRWLARVLSSSQDGQTNTCCTFDATIRTCCDEDDPDKGIYSLCDVAVVDGFSVIDDDSEGCASCGACCDCDVEWRMNVGNPFLFGCVESCGGGLMTPPPSSCGARPSIVKRTPQDQSVDVGDCVLFVIDVANDPAATQDWENVSVVDALLPNWLISPGSVIISQGTGTVDVGNGGTDTNVGVSLGTLAPGQSAQVQFTACLASQVNPQSTNVVLAFSDNEPTISDLHSIPITSAPCDCVPTVDLPTGPCQILTPTTYTVTYPAACDPSEYQTPAWFIDGINQGLGDTFTVNPWVGGQPQTIQVFVLGNGVCTGQALLNQSTTCTSTAAPVCDCTFTSNLPNGSCTVASPVTYSITAGANCDPTEYGTAVWTVDGNTVGTGFSVTIDPASFSTGQHTIAVVVPGAGICSGQTLLSDSATCTFQTVAPCSGCTFSTDLPSQPCAITSTGTYTLSVNPGCDPSLWDPASVQWETIVGGSTFIDPGTTFNLQTFMLDDGPITITVTVPGAGACAGQTIYTETVTCDGQIPCPCNLSVDLPTEPCQLLNPVTYTITSSDPNCDFGLDIDSITWTVDGVNVGTGASQVIDPNAFSAGAHTVRVVVEGDGWCADEGTLLDESVTCTFGVVVATCGNCTVSVTPPLNPPCNLTGTTVYQVQVAGCPVTVWANPEWYIDGNLVATGTFFVLDPSSYSTGIHTIRLFIPGEGPCTGQTIYDQTFSCGFPVQAPAARIQDPEGDSKVCANVEKWLERREMSLDEFVAAVAERTDQLEVDLDAWCESGFPDGFDEIAADVFGVKPSSITGRRS